MAAAAQARGWSYLGISDHSQSAFYAGGLTRDAVLAQHEEIDRVNETLAGFRVLKGIEADILADGRVDYDSETLAFELGKRASYGHSGAELNQEGDAREHFLHMPPPFGALC